jgi:hypothetical protein
LDARHGFAALAPAHGAFVVFRAPADDVIDRQRERSDVEIFFPLDVDGLNAGVVDRPARSGHELDAVAVGIEKIPVAGAFRRPVFLVTQYLDAGGLQASQDRSLRFRRNAECRVPAHVGRQRHIAGSTQHDPLTGCRSHDRMLAGARQLRTRLGGEPEHVAVECRRAFDVAGLQRHKGDAVEADRFAGRRERKRRATRC